MCSARPNRTKFPDTILSRCQRFDFASIETAGITERLAQIAQEEGYEVEPAALDLVARRAAGSMRDSQSLFDQLLAFGSERISADDVHRLLGTADDDRLMTIMNAVIQRDRATALGEFDTALRGGVQVSELVDQLVSYLRDLMVLASGAESVGLLAVSESHRPQLQEQADAWGLETIVAGMQILTETKSRMFRATFGRSLAELAVVRLSMLEDLESVSALVRRLSGEQPAAPARATGAPQKKKS